MGAIFELACFGIGTDKPDEIDVIFEHWYYLLSLARLCRGTRKARGPLPSRGRKFLEGDPNSFWGRSPKPEAAQQNFRTRAPGAGITRSECPVELGKKRD